MKKPEKTLEQLASQPRISRHRLLYFMLPDSNIAFFNQQAKEQPDVSLLAFTQQLAPQIITTAQYRAMGPIKVNYQNQDYLMYDIEPWRSPPLGIRIVLMPLWLKLLVVIGATLLLSLFFSRVLIKPINALKHATSQLANGQLDTRVEITNKSGDELTTLAKDFNQMAQRLESLVTSQKRLMADISHELRSPLTRLQMATGLAQLKQSSEQESYLARIEKEANNLDKMISDVLKLSRLEANNQYIEKELQPLQSILQQVLKDAEFESEQQQKTLTISGASQKQLPLDAALIASAFENILRNAIKYAKSAIHCTIDDSENNTIITICDDGDGVSDADLPYLLEPFYRVSQSRERQSGGAGLGLAIAKQAIELHQGTISLANQPNSGLKVTITLNNETK
ncbi:ATP-binding protein [Pseudoalteromonas sp. SSM20]|uniref:ATP-binding protein n=1 Tax=Pseudoalteromonas sp. SSM20 TaxID=3139394 RepID=UPI003BAD1BBC